MKTVEAVKNSGAVPRCALRCLFDASKDHCAGKRCITAREPHQVRIHCNNNIVEASGQSGGRILTLRTRRALIRRRPVGSRSGPYAAYSGGTLQDASEQPTPGRDRIRLRSQQAKPLPVDLNPYLRRWADLIISLLAHVRSFIRQLLPPVVCFSTWSSWP
jgi:hypothetical protein